MLYFLAAIFVIIVAVLTAVYLLQQRLIFFPEKLPRDYVFEFDWPVEEVFLPSAGNAELHALHFKTHNPKGTVLYFHGNAGSLRGWGFIAGDFLRRGYNVLMPDYRGYGKSTGKLSEEMLHHDATVAWNYLTENTPSEEIIIYGRSLGSGIAVRLAATHTPKALVLETPYNNLVEVAGTHFPCLPASLLLRFSFRSDKWIGNVRCPVYMIHGTQDEVIPYQSAQKLKQAAGPGAVFITVEGGQHNNLADFPEYTRLLDKALK